MKILVLFTSLCALSFSAIADDFQICQKFKHTTESSTWEQCRILGRLRSAVTRLDKIKSEQNYQAGRLAILEACASESSSSKALQFDALAMSTASSVQALMPSVLDFNRTRNQRINTLTGIKNYYILAHRLCRAAINEVRETIPLHHRTSPSLVVEKLIRKLSAPMIEIRLQAEEIQCHDDESEIPLGAITP